jgi:hypothetical protein
MFCLFTGTSAEDSDLEAEEGEVEVEKDEVLGFSSTVDILMTLCGPSHNISRG